MLMKKISVTFFILIFLTFFLSQFILDPDYLNKYTKPWHMQSFAHEDSLSSFVRANYKVIEKTRLYSSLSVTRKPIVNILVDAWGLSMNDSIVKMDFSLFDSLPHEYVIHDRQLNYNSHAEKREFRNNYEKSIYLFGGDSLEYDRKNYIPKIGFSEMVFCQNCSDSAMVKKVDSLLCAEDSLLSPLFIGLTTKSSRGGNRDSLLSSLRIFANLAKKYPESIFLVQGSHRPVLGSTKERKKYYAHWVPAVMINAKEIAK